MPKHVDTNTVVEIIALGGQIETINSYTVIICTNTSIQKQI